MSYEIPLEFIIRDVDSSIAENPLTIETKIKERVDKLTKLFQQIKSCRVVVEGVQKHKHQGKLFRTAIELDVPKKRLVVNHRINEDILISIRDSFNAMEQQLEKYAQKRRKQIKLHTPPLQGEIVRLFEEYGFIETVDGNEYYFHQSNVADEFKKLAVGKHVQFTEATASDGLQAFQVKTKEEAA